jgi:hypothetical protein
MGNVIYFLIIKTLCLKISKYRRQREDQVRALENKKLADKIKQEGGALRQYFLRILEENKEYYRRHIIIIDV